MLVLAALPLGLGGSALVTLIAAAALGTAQAPMHAVALAVQAWASFTGFFINRYGQLTLGSHDVRNLAGFVIGTIVLAQVFKGPSMPPLGGGQP